MFMPQTDAHAVFIQRLKQARKAVGLSQAALGHKMGLPDEIASTRINRYEVGKSEPDLKTAEAMAKALGVSLSWLVCTDPKLASIIEGYSKLPTKAQDTILAQVEAALAKIETDPVPQKSAIRARKPGGQKG
jgi:transcriptional regulator with XRE-family HTH domain